MEGSISLLAEIKFAQGPSDYIIEYKFEMNWMLSIKSPLELILTSYNWNYSHSAICCAENH